MAERTSTAGYHETRFSDESRRDTLWRALWDVYFSKRIGPDDCVLDIGAGYGHFINTVAARRRVALDAWPGLAAHAAPGVETIIGDAADLSALKDAEVDYAFASNIFEHLPQEKVAAVLRALRRKLSPRGSLTILQPNYAYAYREYFDDYTHCSVWSHVSLGDFLNANGFDVVERRARFLPLTIKSRLPVSPFLIRLYLHAPIKPLGKQMLFVAKPAASD